MLLFVGLALADAPLPTDPAWTVSGIVGFPGGLGVDVARRLTDGFALSGQLATWVAISDLGVRGRGFLVRGERWSFVVGGGVHALVAPVLFSPGALAVELGPGVAYQAPSGFTFGLDGGPALWLSLPHHTEGGGGVSVAEFAQLAVGWRL